MRRTIRTVLLVAGLSAASVAAQQHAPRFPPEDLGLLEAPDREIWQQPDKIMDALGIAENGIVADLGAGGGWFTIRLARRVGPNGRVYAEDVQPQMIKVIERRSALEGLKNITLRLGTDVDPGLPSGKLDAVLLVDSFHEVEKPVGLLQNVARSLKVDGLVGIVGFTKDGGGPGPPLEERVDPDRVVRDAESAGLRLVKRETFLRYQYMLVFGKRR